LDEEKEILNIAQENYKSKNDDIQNAFLTKEMQRLSSLIPGGE